jgi:hypothetical protein
MDEAAIELEWGYPPGALRRPAPCRGPFFCPESGNVECCPEHSGSDHCCYFPQNHGPVPCICPEPGEVVMVRWRCLLHSGALAPDGTWARGHGGA